MIITLILEIRKFVSMFLTTRAESYIKTSAITTINFVWIYHYFFFCIPTQFSDGWIPKYNFVKQRFLPFAIRVNLSTFQLQHISYSFRWMAQQDSPVHTVPVMITSDLWHRRTRLSLSTTKIMFVLFVTILKIINYIQSVFLFEFEKKTSVYLINNGLLIF